MGGRFANREPNRNSGGRALREPRTEPNRRGAPTSRNANRNGHFFANFTRFANQSELTDAAFLESMMRHERGD